MISFGTKFVASAVLGAMAIFGISEANSTVTKDEEVEEPVKYTVETIYDNTMREGTTKVNQEGKDGTKKVTYAVTYRHDKEVNRSVKSEKTVTPAKNKIVVEGTKKYYKCSNGKEFDNVNDRDECEKKIKWTAQKDKALKECNADKKKFNCWYDKYPGTTAHWTEYTYTAPRTTTYAPRTTTRAPQSSGYRTGAICRDGWRSSATGRGACSHHGGVSQWL
ncbi:G5 domain-containing protein [Candidatus Saccharibacteria bacterium]|nr:G5 domain-containing protein [Candidatus Saccharibacteria bacterium]